MSDQRSPARRKRPAGEITDSQLGGLAGGCLIVGAIRNFGRISCASQLERQQCECRFRNDAVR